MTFASESTQSSVAGYVLSHFYYIMKAGDYIGQKDCDDKNDKSRKDSKDKQK